MKKTFLFLLILLSYQTFAQNNRQDIRGLVTDKLSQTLLIGANLQIIGQLNGKSTATLPTKYNFSNLISHPLNAQSNEKKSIIQVHRACHSFSSVF